MFRAGFAARARAWVFLANIKKNVCPTPAEEIKIARLFQVFIYLISLPYGTYVR